MKSNPRSRSSQLRSLTTHLVVGSIGAWAGWRLASPQTAHLQPQAATEVVVSSGSASTSPSANSNPPAALPTAFHTVTPPASDDLFRKLPQWVESIQTLKAEEALDALRILEAMPQGPDRLIQQQLLIARFAALDPETALSYVDRLQGAEASSARLTAFATWAETAPAAAGRHVIESLLNFATPQPGDEKIIASVASSWAKKNPEEALAWCAELPEGARTDALAGVAGQLAASDPSAAMRLVGRIESREEQREVLQALSAQWAANWPTQTASWALGVSDASGREAAIGTLVNTWAGTQPEAAAQWIQSLPEGAARDASLAAWNQSDAFFRDPQTSVTWATFIQDEHLRSETTDAALNRWRAIDPQGAEAWIQSH